jgi:hypothetical protein
MLGMVRQKLVSDSLTSRGFFRRFPRHSGFVAGAGLEPATPRLWERRFWGFLRDGGGYRISRICRLRATCTFLGLALNVRNKCGGFTPVRGLGGNLIYGDVDQELSHIGDPVSLG